MQTFSDGGATAQAWLMEDRAGSGYGRTARRTRLANEFDAYVPMETGVGCAEHGNPACLCDVVIEDPCKVLCATDEILMGRVSAEIMDGINATGADLAEWACNMLALYDLSRNVEVTLDDIGPLLMARWRASNRTLKGGLAFIEKQVLCRELLALRLTYQEAADYFCITPQEVARYASPVLYKKFGFEVLGGLWTQLLAQPYYHGLSAQLARKYGMTTNQVRQFSLMANVPKGVD